MALNQLLRWSSKVLGGFAVLLRGRMLRLSDLASGGHAKTIAGFSFDDKA
jgi:hypothetical protein